MVRDRDDEGHAPVMADELIGAVAVERDGRYVDATFGRGGHASRLLDALSAKGRVLAIDRDAEAVACAERLAAVDGRLRVERGRFGALAEHIPGADFGHLDGVMFDVGVSSPQLDDPARGFSFQADGPLDMRMDQRDAETAGAWLNSAGEAEIASVLRRYGEEHYARRVARRIVAARPLASTAQLAEAVRRALPDGGATAKHPATRVFQAVRIHINDELGELERGLAAAFAALRIGGRVAAITFHGLEHRLVRRCFREWVEGAQLPRRLPVRDVAPVLARRVAPVGKGQRPSAAEVAVNPRARSALLQAVEKVAEAPSNERLAAAEGTGEWRGAARNAPRLAARNAPRLAALASRGRVA